MVGPVGPTGPTGPTTPFDPQVIQEPSTSILTQTFSTPSSGGAPNLEEALISFLEFATLIDEVTRKHRQVVDNAVIQDFKLFNSILDDLIAQASNVEELTAAVIELVTGWIEQVAEIEQNVANARTALEAAVQAFNDAIDDSVLDDNTNADAVNTVIDLHNSLQGLSQQDFDDFVNNYPGGETQLLADINDGITTWNTYANTRNPQVAALVNDINAAKATWEAVIASSNAVIATINAERADLGLIPISSYDPGLTITITPPVPFVLPLVSLVADLGPGNPTISNVPNRTVVGEATGVPLPEDLVLAVKPFPNEIFFILTFSIVSILAFVDDALAFLREVIDEEQEIGRPSLLPAAFIERSEQVFVSSIGQGAGLGLVGLQDSSVNRVFSREAFLDIARESNMPLPPRFIGQLQLLALGLASQSALLSAIPVAQVLGNRLGSIAITSPTAATVLAIGIVNRIVTAISSNTTRSLVNRSLNNLIFQARRSGADNPFAGLSAGAVGQVGSLLGASLNVSLLAIAIGLIGRNTGFPNLSLNFIANVNGFSPTEALAAQVGGAQLGDVLSNPLSLLFIKNSLKDLLLLRTGFVSSNAANIVNNALNAAISTLGGKFGNANIIVGTLRREFILQGLRPDNASLLAVETLRLIRGEIGIPGLNGAVKDNIDAIETARGVIDAILGTGENLTKFLIEQAEKKDRIMAQILKDREAVAEILREAIDFSIRSGQFEINRELRNTLVGRLREKGLRAGDANFLANQTINFLAGDTVTSPVGITAGRAEQLQSASISRLQSELGVSRARAEEVFQNALQRAVNQLPFSSEAEFVAILRSEILRESAGAEKALDLATADVSDTNVLSLQDLHKAFGTHVFNLLVGEFGDQKAGSLRDQLLGELFGTPTASDLARKEKYDPNSVLAQVDKLVDRLGDKAKNLLEEMLKPNAETGFVIQSVQDKPTTLINSLAAGQGANKQGDILGV